MPAMTGFLAGAPARVADGRQSVVGCLGVMFM